VVASVGYEPAPFLKRIEEPALKERLRANTDDLIARGGFGSPTMFVDGDDMYFGNDRLPLLEAALARTS
jgi:2-hydroxychromene-2-carboxylate isomerase